MKAYLIDPNTRSVVEAEFDGQPNSLFTLFNSLLVDSDAVLHGHNVYRTSEAFERGERGFFLGEKLIFGKALVTGSDGLADTDAAVTAEELLQLSLFDIPDFYLKTLALLPPDFSFEEHYQLHIGEIGESVTPEWVFYVYNMADSATKTYFLNRLEESVTQGADIRNYLKKMAELAVKSMQ